MENSLAIVANSLANARVKKRERCSIKGWWTSVVLDDTLPNREQQTEHTKHYVFCVKLKTKMSWLTRRLSSRLRSCYLVWGEHSHNFRLAFLRQRPKRIPILYNNGSVVLRPIDLQLSAVIINEKAWKDRWEIRNLHHYSLTPRLRRTGPAG